MIVVHPSAQIHPTARIDVETGSIGAGAILREGVIIEGRSVEIGRDAFFGRGAWIGGGGCRDPESRLVAGDFLHVGAGGHINTARAVTLGHEVGIGIASKLFTHGAYLSAWDGFPATFAPVTVGDRVWLPNAWINPGVRIGSDVVVAPRSWIARHLPSGCFAAGAPVAIQQKNAFPRRLGQPERLALVARLIDETTVIAGQARGWSLDADGLLTLDGGTHFDLEARIIAGPADRFTETLRQQLRRNGIRFRYEAADGAYRAWSPEPGYQGT